MPKIHLWLMMNGFFSDKETAKTPTVQSLTEELTWAQKMVKKLEKNIQKRYDEAE